MRESTSEVDRQHVENIFAEFSQLAATAGMDNEKRKAAGSLLDCIRQQLGYSTQASFAAAMRVDTQTVNRWVKGITVARKNNIQRLQKLVFGSEIVSPDTEYLDSEVRHADLESLCSVSASFQQLGTSLTIRQVLTCLVPKQSN